MLRFSTDECLKLFVFFLFVIVYLLFNTAVSRRVCKLSISLYKEAYAYDTVFESCLMIACITDVSKSMSARQKLEAQLTENNIVKEVRNIVTYKFPEFWERGILCPMCNCV